MTKRIGLFAILMAAMLHISAQGFLRADGQRIVNEKGESVLLRGMGLGGWMLQEGYMLKVPGEGQQYRIRERIQELIGAEETTKFYDLWLLNHTRRIDVDSMKAWGFNSIRLPMHYNLYTLPIEKEPEAGKDTWLDKGFAMTDSLLQWCKANEVYLILDLHAAPGGQGNDFNISDRDPSKPSLWDSKENQRKTIALWRKLAERYKDEPWIGGYDIINEPNWGFEDSTDKNGLKETKNIPLKNLMVDITRAIREVDNKHIVIIEGNGWGNNYNGVLPPWDNNMVLSFHKYWNTNDIGSIQHIINTREQYNVPVWLGETGENSNLWFRDAIHLLESNNIGWAWWPLKKLGHNNPLQVRSNHQYDAVLKYWNSKGSKPARADAQRGLFELANNLKLESNIFHRDVIDAMFRQPHTDATIPFKNHIIDGNSVINAVDYDLGRNRFAYFDMDTANYRTSGKPGIGNRGNVYRNDGVDIRVDSSKRESFYVSDIEKNEWLNYTINVRKTGSYDIHLFIASQQDDGIIELYIGDKLIGSVSIKNTGSMHSFKPVTVKASLKSGVQTMKLKFLSGGFNFQQIKIGKGGN